MRDLALLVRIYEDAPLADSDIHGVRHWVRVALNGKHLIDAGAPAKRDVVELFAILHDACRRDEGDDPEHGRRAARYATRLYGEGLIDLDAEDLDTLVTAIALHAHGARAPWDATAGVCWDADRLDLVRVNVLPVPHLMSTKQGVDAVARIFGQPA